MDAKTLLVRLDQLGSEAIRKTYARHGAKPPISGVKFGDLKQLQKKIGVDQPLAEALWASGNHDARVLATMIADVAQFTAARLETWLSSLDGGPLATMFLRLAGNSDEGLPCALRWI